MNCILSFSNILSSDVCRELIELFEKSNNLQLPGSTIGGNNQEVKKSTDIPIDPTFLNDSDWNHPLNYFLDKLRSCTDEYVENFPYLKEVSNWGLDHHFNFQRYFPKEGYYKLHSEVPNKNYGHRILSWIVYLNDVKNSGTYFLHQNHTEECEEGKIIIFPAYWTHAHRGIISQTETKYILTGWFTYV